MQVSTPTYFVAFARPGNAQRVCGRWDAIVIIPPLCCLTPSSILFPCCLELAQVAGLCTLNAKRSALPLGAIQLCVLWVVVVWESVNLGHRYLTHCIQHTYRCNAFVEILLAIWGEFHIHKRSGCGFGCWMFHSQHLSKQPKTLLQAFP